MCWFIIFVILSYSIIPCILYKLFWYKKSHNMGTKKVVFLTFDDGPNSNYTSELLDVLKQFNIKASFFVVTDFAKENTNLIQRMKLGGHDIGIHSCAHKSSLYRGWKYTSNDLSESIKVMEDMHIKVLGYRPPWGHLNLVTLYMLKKLNLKLILWGAMAQDWKANTTSKEISKKIITRVEKGNCIFCLHDGRGSENAPERTISALKESIPILIERGYKFKSLGEYYQSIYE